MSSNNPATETVEKKKVPWYSYVALVLTLLCLTGALKNVEGPLACLDFTNLLGSFGKLGTSTVEGVTLASDFTGTGGVGVKHGFIFAFTIGPAIALAFGVIELYNAYGGNAAAEKVFGPIMKVLLGLPGSAVLGVIGNLTSSDAGALVARSLHDQGLIDRTQNMTMTAFMYPGAAILVNYYMLGPMIFPALEIPLFVPLVVIIVMKIVAAVLVRIFFSIKSKKEEK